MDWDRALDNGDAYTCKHCGKTMWIEIGMGSHVCEEGRKASRDQAEAYEKMLVGDGSRVNELITIEISRYNTEESLRQVLESISMYFEDGHGEDKILGYAWKKL